jgi:V8-like Glu-specific endopeptidase
MRRAARRDRSGRKPVRLVAVLAAAAGCAALMLVPADGGAAGLTHRDVLTANEKPTASHTGQDFTGVAAVGALFSETSGKLSTHFCTASVVHSTHGDLVVTAAHCLIGVQGQVVFVPGYDNGKEPYGIWPVAAVYTDKAWQSDEDPDDDVAFLRLSDASGGVPIENVTGAEQLGADSGRPALVRVIGYPGEADQPVSCTNWTKIFSATQLEFDCGGYTDGTSGGPFLANVSTASGEGTIIGVIGGYDQGGDTPEVSYASAFGPTVTALFHTAESGG